MKKIILLMFTVLVLVSVNLVIAVPTYQQSTQINLIVTCTFNGTACIAGTTCFISIINPGGDVLANNQTMTQSASIFNYTLTSAQTSISGDYEATVACNDGSNSNSKVLTFPVTPSGQVQTSILDNPILLIFGFLGFVLLILGMYAKNPWIGFIGSVMFILGGVYTMIYGLNNVTDLYTRGVAITFLGLGFIVMMASAYELISDSDDD